MTRREGGYQLGPEMWARLRVVIRDAEGEPVQDEPVEQAAVFGMGTLLPALERALEGLPAGARKTVWLPPEQAFGKRDPKAILEVLRDEFPPDVAPGDAFDAEDEEDGNVVLRVLEVTPDTVILDRNHPLAGQRVGFDVEVLEVRPATEDEVQRAVAALDGEKTAEPSLIPAESLLRGRTRR